MRFRSVQVTRCVLLLAIGACASVHGQSVAPPLTSFVNSPASNASVLQQRTGGAVQRMCTSLAAEGGLQLSGAKQDLFLRCNELVETARALQGLGNGTGRSLGYTDRAQLLAAIQQTSGEELAAQGVLSTQVSSGQFANIAGRLNALRLGSGAAAARGRLAQLEPATPTLALNSRRGVQLGAGAAADSETSGADAQRLGWFTESSYGFGDHDQTRNEDAFDFDSISVTTGTDYRFGSGIVGFALGFDRYTSDFDSASLVSGGDVEVEGLSGSLFGGVFGARWTLNGIATYGSLESELTRRVLYASANPACLDCGVNRALTGDPDGDYVALGLTVGYELSVAGWDVAPSLSASYRDVTIDGFEETDSLPGGGLAFRYDEQSIESTRSILAIAISRPISRSFGVLVPSLRAEWHHEFDAEPRAVRAKYVLEDSLLAGASAPRDFGCAISCFTLLTDRADEDFAIASIGVSATFARRLQAYLMYEALLGAANLSGNSIALGIRGQL